MRQRERKTSTRASQTSRDRRHKNDNKSIDYDVGYQRPPKHSQFAAGKSGNPRGRPRGQKNLETIFVEQLRERVRIDPNSNKTISRLEFIVRRFVQLAMKGEPRALQVIRDFVETDEGRSAFQPFNIIISEEDMKF